MTKNFFIVLIFISMLNSLTYAAVNDKQVGDPKQSEFNNNIKLQKVIDEYKAYIADINPELRNEIIEYRKEIVRINRLKKEAYQKLSQDAQNYMAKEQEFKKRLPLRQRRLVNIENPGEKNKSEENKE